jgi:hypothetical protein
LPDARVDSDLWDEHASSGDYGLIAASWTPMIFKARARL